LGRRPPNLESVLRWLDRGGEGCADLANAARQVFGSGTPLKDEVEDTLADSFRIAIGDRPHLADRDSCGQPGQFLGDLGKTRLQLARSQVRDAIRLLEEASALGSAVAAEALWFERCGPLRDDGRALAEWLETRPDPHSVRKNAALATAVALEVGRKHMPANFAEAIRWYRAAFRYPPGASEALDGRLCLNIAGELKSWKSKDFAHLERAWLRRGMDCGDPECLERWLEPIAHGKEPATVAEAGAVLECANRIATRATEKSCSYAFSISRRFFGNEPGPDDSTGARWSIAGARLGHPYCRYMLVTYLIDGRGLALDLPEAQRQLDEWVADEDLPLFKLRLRLADAYAAGGNIAAARAILEKVAGIGNEQEQAGAREALAKLVPAGS
jgi:TPR repeat protein